MATENKILDLSYEAAEDLSNDQFRIVVLASGKIQRPDAATDVPSGLLQNAPIAGEAAVVRQIGASKIVFGGTVAENEWIGPEFVDAADAGKGIKVSLDNAIATGRCIVGGDEDEVGEIMLSGNPVFLGVGI